MEFGGEDIPAIPKEFQMKSCLVFGLQQLQRNNPGPKYSRQFCSPTRLRGTFWSRPFCAGLQGFQALQITCLNPRLAFHAHWPLHTSLQLH
eukprot:364390-Chlamydomonas_euryale.AAC.1